MTKKDKSVLIEALKKLSADVADIATLLEGTEAPAKKQDVPATEEATAPAKVYSYEEVRAILAEKPRIGENKFGGESVTYMGIDAQKKWSRIESYGPKFVENIVQAVSRDILASAMRMLCHCQIVGHVHDELIIECSPDVSLDAICEQMGRTPSWLPGIDLRADGYTCQFYQKQ